MFKLFVEGFGGGADRPFRMRLKHGFIRALVGDNTCIVNVPVAISLSETLVLKDGDMVIGNTFNGAGWSVEWRQ